MNSALEELGLVMDNELCSSDDESVREADDDKEEDPDFDDLDSSEV